jgi:hypothetical protein
MQLATPNGVGYRVWYRAIGSGWQGPLQFQGMERPHPKGKASFKTRGLDGLAGSKPRHRNGPFDWVAIHSLIERQLKADGRGGPPELPRCLRSVDVFSEKYRPP